MSLGYHSDGLSVKDRTYTKKRGASLCCSLHVLRPSHCPVCRNEQRRKPHDDGYNDITRTFSHNGRLQEMFRMMYIYTPQGVPVALFLTDSLKLRSSNTSKPKRTVTPFMYMCPPLRCPLSELPARVGFAKIAFYTETSNKKTG